VRRLNANISSCIRHTEAAHYKPGPPDQGLSRLTILGRIFNEAAARQPRPIRISTDNDPLFRYRRWIANLSILEIEEIKSLPYTPMSHPFIGRLIGSVRRELLDQTFFWTQTDLENKLRVYQQHFNEHRCHSGRAGSTPIEFSDYRAIDLIR